MEGKIKWYNEEKGFGFIIGEDGKEYFVHYSSIPKDIGTINDNDDVSFEVEQTPKGPQAKKVDFLKK